MLEISLHILDIVENSTRAGAKHVDIHCLIFLAVVVVAGIIVEFIF